MKNKVRVNPGVGYTFYGGPEGVAFDIQQGGGSVIYHPFKIKAFKKNGSNKVTVSPGTCNNFVPKIGGVWLDATIAPELSIGTSGPVRIYLKVTKSGALFFPYDVEIISSTEELSNSDDIGYFTLGSITMNSKGNIKSVNQFIYSSCVVVRAKPGTATAVWAFSSR